MCINLRITLIVAICIYFCCIVFLLKKGRLELRYTLLWLLGGLMMVVVVAFPQITAFLTKLFGIIDEVNAVFATVLFLFIIILISLTSIVSKLRMDLRTLVQKCALYEKRIRTLEERQGKVCEVEREEEPECIC